MVKAREKPGCDFRSDSTGFKKSRLVVASKGQDGKIAAKKHSEYGNAAPEQNPITSHFI
jgi:hypothetical protein